MCRNQTPGVPGELLKSRKLGTRCLDGKHGDRWILLLAGCANEVNDDVGNKKHNVARLVFTNSPPKLKRFLNTLQQSSIDAGGT